MLELPPELQPLIREILLRLSKHGNYGRGAAAIASLRALVGDLPASANHHHSEPNGLLRHSLEVGLKMVEEVDRRLAAQAELDPSAGVSEVSPDAPQWQYLCFLAGLGHDLGKLFDMDVQAGDQRWSPLHETHADFLRHVRVELILRWDERRVRGGHAQLSAWLMHYLLTPADFSFIGVERLPLACSRTHRHPCRRPINPSGTPCEQARSGECRAGGARVDDQATRQQGQPVHPLP